MLVAVQPLHGLFHGRRPEPARDRAAGLGAREQPGLGQNIEVLHHGRQRHANGPRQIGDREALLPSQTREQRTPRRIGQGGKRPIQGGMLILNHEVKF